ncbi:hypothetical protein E2C01_068871 [Portunus trituberculatus]|uniref:Uncharacterized protein n=1 Tax=Portunus trituberculatus TaxID=210409 RepID=A0A5B7HNK1_PORTR|nr:hypothetical protein [Portunus trituberculatus]
MDPNVEQSSTATRKAMDALFCYTVMQKEFSKKKRQTTMLQFFKKTSERCSTEDPRDLAVRSLNYCQFKLI